MTSYTHRIDEFSFALKIELGLLEGAEASLLWRWVEELAANDPTIAVQEYHISIVSVSGMYRMIPSTYRKPIVTAVSGACIVSWKVSHDIFTISLNIVTYLNVPYHPRYTYSSLYHYISTDISMYLYVLW